jgi:hypothetical protein
MKGKLEQRVIKLEKRENIEIRQASWVDLVLLANGKMSKEQSDRFIWNLNFDYMWS